LEVYVRNRGALGTEYCTGVGRNEVLLLKEERKALAQLWLCDVWGTICGGSSYSRA
jgi:hypothetical protein